MNEPHIGAFIRATTANHTDTPPDCDDFCWSRWYDMPHLHICPDGLNSPGPLMTITSWCSCGVRVSGPLELDARDEAMVAAAEAESAGTLERFQAHAIAVHGLDIMTNEEWQQRLATPPA